MIYFWDIYLRLWYHNVILHYITTVQGQAAYRHINKAFVLHQAVRQAEKAPFCDLLLRLRNGNSSYEDYTMQTDRFSGVIDENLPSFQHATRLFPTTAAVHDYNALRLLSLQATTPQTLIFIKNLQNQKKTNSAYCANVSTIAGPKLG